MSQETTISVRYDYLDGLRGLAASAVVLTHFVAALYPHGIFGGATTLQGGWEKVFLYPPFGLLVAGHFAVCLFFLLSGYVLALPLLLKGTPWRDIVAAMVKRPFRLLGIVLATILISWLLWRAGLYHNHEVAMASGSGWFGQFWPNPAPKGDILAWHLTTAPFEMATTYNQPLWTIKRELIGSFLVYGILLFGQFRPLRWCVMLAGAWWFRGNFFQCFILGLMFADWQCARSMAGTPRPVSMPGWLCVLLIFVTIVCGSYPKYAMTSAAAHEAYWFSPPLRWLGGGWSMVGAVALFLLVLHAPAAQRFLSRRTMLFLGKVSYSLYGVHFLVLGTACSWVFISALPACGYLGSAALALLTLIIITLVCASALHSTVDAFFIWVARAIGTRVVRLLTPWRSWVCPR
jgi:peptidoglycan/LPS O-acetylase OafA/YrhL